MAPPRPRIMRVTRALRPLLAALAGLFLAGLVSAPAALADRATLSGWDYGACAVQTDRTVACWGSDGYLNSPQVPTLVAGLRPATSVSAGRPSCIAAVDTSSQCWGKYTVPYLDVPRIITVTPELSPPPTGTIDTASSDRESCRLASTGIAYCQGLLVGELTDATALSSDGTAFCALRRTREVACWSRRPDTIISQGGSLGQLAIATWLTDPVATAILGVSDAVALSGTCALLQAGTVTCWSFRQPTAGGPVVGPGQPVAGVTDAVDLAAMSVSGGHSCAVIRDGSVRCWGANGAGELGDGTTASSTAPVRVAGITDATDVAVGYGFSCARLADASIRCWGQRTGSAAVPSSPAPIEPDGNLRVLASDEPRPAGPPPTTPDPTTPSPTTATASFSLSGSTRLGPMTRGSLPLAGRLNGVTTAADGSFAGAFSIADTKGSARALAALPVTLMLGFKPVGPLSGSTAAGLTTATVQARVAVRAFRLFGLIPLATTTTCQTRQPVTFTLAGPGALAPGTVLTGRYVIGPLTGCGPAQPLLSALLPGGGNTITLKLG